MMRAQLYVKKPVVIEAFEWTGKEEDLANLNDFCDSFSVLPVVTSPIKAEARKAIVLIIPTLEGDHTALPGDFIIKGIAGEFYPCKPDIFWKTYDPV